MYMCPHARSVCYVCVCACYYYTISHMVIFFNEISPGPIMSFIHPISHGHHFVATVIKYSPIVSSLYTHTSYCHGYRSIIVLLTRTGNRLIPSITLSLGIGMLAKLRAVVNQSIKLPN